MFVCLFWLNFSESLLNIEIISSSKLFILIFHWLHFSLLFCPLLLWWIFNIWPRKLLEHLHHLLSFFALFSLHNQLICFLHFLLLIYHHIELYLAFDFGKIDHHWLVSNHLLSLFDQVILSVNFSSIFASQISDCYASWSSKESGMLLRDG